MVLGQGIKWEIIGESLFDCIEVAYRQFRGKRVELIALKPIGYIDGQELFIDDQIFRQEIPEGNYSYFKLNHFFTKGRPGNFWGGFLVFRKEQDDSTTEIAIPTGGGIAEVAQSASGRKVYLGLWSPCDLRLPPREQHHGQEWQGIGDRLLVLRLLTDP